MVRLRAAVVGRVLRRFDPITRGWTVVFSGSIARLALGFVASVLLARALGPGGYGTLALLSAAAGIAGTAFDLGLTDSAIRFIAQAYARDCGQAQERIQVFFWLRVATVLLLVGPATVGSALVIRWLHLSSAFAFWFPLAMAGVGATALSGAVSAILQATGHYVRFSAVSLTNAALTAVLAVALRLTGHLNLFTALSLLGIGTALVACAVGGALLPRGWQLRLPERAALRQEGLALFRFGRWLWVANVFAMLSAQLDLLMLGHWQSGAVVGLYALALNLATKADVANQSLYAVLLPAAAVLRGDVAVRRYLRQGFLRSVAISALLLPLFPLAAPFISLVYGPGYAGAALLFRLLLGVIIFDILTTPLLLLTYAYERPQVLAGADALRTATLALSGSRLIPLGGAYGAIGARFAARLAGAALIAALLWREWVRES